MVIQTINTSGCCPQTIVIGRRGTYDTMQIAFDLSYLVESFGNGVAVLAVKRSQDSSAYPAVVTQEDNTLTWTVSETDTAYAGAGECQLMWYVVGGLAKTIIYPMVVMRDILATSEDAPDAYQNWIESLTALGAETLQNAQDAAQSASDAEDAKDDAVTAKEAAESAQQAAETAVTHYPKIENNYWMVWDSTSQSYVSTGIQAEGEDGYSPEVTITSIEGGHRVTITDKDHPQGQSFDVMDGQGGGGTSDYTDLTNKPSINNVTLTGNKTAADLGLATPSDIPTDAGDIAFDDSATYAAGSIGAEVSQQKNAISEDHDTLTELYSDVKTVRDIIVAQSTINTVAGTGVYADDTRMNVNVPSGSKYVMLVSGDATVFPNGFFFYAGDSLKGAGLQTNTEYEYTADTDISDVSIYVSGANVAKTDSLQFSISLREINNNSLESRIENAEDDIDDIEEELETLESKVSADNARLIKLDGIIDANWVDGDASGDTYYNGKRVHNDPAVYMPNGTILTISDTNYKFNVHRVSTQTTTGWLNTYTSVADDTYVITIRTADDSAYVSISDISSKLAITVPNVIDDVSNLKSTVAQQTADIAYNSSKIDSYDSRLSALDGVVTAEWVDGDASGDPYYNRKRIHNDPAVHLPVGTVITIADTDYKFKYQLPGGSGSAWENSITTNVEGDYTITVTSVDVTEYSSIEDLSSKITIVSPDGITTEVNQLKVKSENNENRSCLAINPFRVKPCLEHLYITYTGSNYKIPQQSVFDVRMAKKWGFDVIEANICTTQDGKHFTAHAGSHGNFGTWFVHVDGTTDISEMEINNVTWDWIAQNVVYNTSVAKYRTRPCLLSEFLYECRQQNLIPLVYIADDDVMQETIDIMGEDNFIAYNGNRSKLPSTIISYFGSEETKAAILNVCNSNGKPFIYGMAHPDNFTDAELKEIIAELHNNGFLISCAYVDADWYKYRYLGFDMIGAMQSINRIEHGNICNIHSINGFSGFTVTNATESNGVLTFTADGTISPDIESTNYDFCGIDVEIEFIGTITLPSKGEAFSATYTSDGTIPFFKSIPVINGNPVLAISCASGTIIKNIDFKASEF